MAGGDRAGESGTLTYLARLTPSDLSADLMRWWDVRVDELRYRKERLSETVLVAEVAFGIVEAAQIPVRESSMLIAYPRCGQTLEIAVHTAHSLGLDEPYGTAAQIREATKRHESFVASLPEGAVLKLIPGPEVWDVRRTVGTFVRLRAEGELGVLASQNLPIAYGPAAASS